MDKHDSNLPLQHTQSTEEEGEGGKEAEEGGSERVQAEAVVRTMGYFLRGGGGEGGGGGGQRGLGV